MTNRIKFVKKDITKQKSDIVIHQVNNKNAMGSGVALAIAKVYPRMKEEYHKMCNEYRLVYPHSYEKDLLGNAQFVKVNSQTHKYIVNVFGQNGYGSGHKNGIVYTNYNALFKGLQIAFAIADERKMSIAIPNNMGAFRAGGDWSKIYYEITQLVMEYPNIPVVYICDYQG